MTPMATDTLISAERSPDCPGDDEFRRLLRESDPHATEWLETHLETCGFCRRRLDLLAGIEPLVPKGGWAGSEFQKTAALRALMDRAARREFADEAASGRAALELNGEILSPPVQPGSLGRFAGCDVLARIANGGMGVVFKALDPALNRMVAIKVLAPALAANEAARLRFLREARAAAAVTHEHVVAIHAVGEERGLPFLVMPFVAGPSLDACLQNGPLDLERILRIGRQTALGLAAAHAQGLIHRDIKPGNILLENGVERVKLTDFGLARAVDSPAITRDGVIAGTPEFMSPEQARGERIDARSDLFSLGCVLYLMATGRPPFRADSTPATLKRVCELDPPLAHLVNPAIPVWLSELIALLMAKEPDRRVAEANQLARLLEEGLSRLQLGTKDGPEKPALVSEYSPRQRRRRWFASGVLAAGALCIGLMLWMRRGPVGESGALASPAKLGLFRLVKAGATPREFATLKEAVLQAENGSSIEVRFDGPETFDPVDISHSDVRMRAARGMRPILVNREPGVSFLSTTGSLTLEGLEIRAWHADCDSTALGNPDSDTKQLITEKIRDRFNVGDGVPALIRVRGGNLTARNCRFVTSLRDSRSTDGIEVVGSRKVELTGCEFYALDGMPIRWRSMGKRVAGAAEATFTLAISNSLFLSVRSLAMAGQSGECDVRLDQNTFVSLILFTLGPRAAPSVTASRNAFVVRGLYDARPRMGVLPPDRWIERNNIFFNDPKSENPLVQTVAIHPDASSRSVKLGFRERMKPLVTQARRLTPEDFRITAEDAAETSGMSLEEMRQYGCRPESVGPSGRVAAGGQ